ncbi:Protein of unknown function [Treponema bryantii]|uniref:DUF3990 domain-containing protein n=1 Tax=Treponema bryantii TaxID=163 RepID=A0A1H9J4I6_9SPIR|nr:DUF3990 domain-containing protein [Treponema bryantii]SEQ81676.1 Protein of unknown function [Treponema bryantii]
MISNQRIKLFHGSKNGLNDKIQPISRSLCDFGKGFYMGTEQEQPLTLICNYENATLYELELNTSNLTIKEIPLNLDWALFVAFNRGRLNKDSAPQLYKNYESYKNQIDVFKGYIANDRMFVVLDRFFDGAITDVALVESLSALKLGIQYVAITQKACDSIRVINEHKLTAEQKNQLIIKSEENRKTGISLADEICKQYRREGKYFDEIINE